MRIKKLYIRPMADICEVESTGSMLAGSGPSVGLGNTDEQLGREFLDDEEWQSIWDENLEF